MPDLLHSFLDPFPLTLHRDLHLGKAKWEEKWGTLIDERERPSIRRNALAFGVAVTVRASHPRAI